MTTTTRLDRSVPPGRASRRGVATNIDVLVCGSNDRGDDGAPLAASRLLEADPPPYARVRRIGQLDVDDLLAIAPGGGVVVVDAATGIDPGTIVALPLRALLGTDAAVQPRSLHALAIPEVMGLADMIRGRPLAGRIVVIGARRFGLGRPLTRRVAKAVPGLAEAVRVAIEQVAETIREERRRGIDMGAAIDPILRAG
jgi:hydrogenase maturation protease